MNTEKTEKKIKTALKRMGFLDMEMTRKEKRVLNNTQVSLLDLSKLNLEEFPFLENYAEDNDENRIVPNLNIKSEATAIQTYDIDFLINSLNIIRSFGDDNVKLYMISEAPICLESKHLTLYLAPKMVDI